MKLQLIRPGRWVPFAASVPGGPILAGKVRPLHRDELAAARAESAKLTGEAREKYWVKLIAGCILEWDATDTDPSGNELPAPITPESLNLIPEPYFLAIENHITGYVMSPEATATEKKS